MKIFQILLAANLLALAYGQLETCSAIRSGVSKIVLKAAASNETGASEIPLISVLYDPARQVPYTSTQIMDSLNAVKSVNRTGEPFRYIPCENLEGKQQNCKKQDSFEMTEAQKAKANGVDKVVNFQSWARGHLVPVSPNKFSEGAHDATFYCVNQAPQEQWSNKCPWYAVEERTVTYFTGKKPVAGYVITGTCAADSPDGDSENGYKVPNCFYKVLCYIDAETKKTVTVGFVGENSVINAGNLETERKSRMNSTLTPRNLSDILTLTKAGIIKTAFAEAEKSLKIGRTFSGPLPTDDSCMKALTLDDIVKTQWTVYMTKYRRGWTC